MKASIEEKYEGCLKWECGAQRGLTMGTGWVKKQWVRFDKIRRADVETGGRVLRG